jgi:hypothetical protein
MKPLRFGKCVLAVLMLAAGSAFASPYTYSYNVTVDTGSLSSTGGYLYFQFARDPNNFLATATALIRDFSTDGTLGAKASGISATSGAGVTGALPGSVAIANRNQINDYNQAVTFGDVISFMLDLNQRVLDPLYTNTFSMWLAQDAQGAVPLQTPSGELFEVNLFGDGTASVVNYDTAGTTVVPEPGTALMLITGLLGFARMKTRNMS